MLSLSVNRAALADALALAFGAIEKRTTIPRLNHFKLTASTGELEITATDLEIAARVRIAATVDSPGRMLLPAKRLLDYVRLLPGDEVTIAEGSNLWATVASGKPHARIAGMAADSFPEIPTPGEAIAAVKPQAFATLLRRVAIAISREESRFNLASALLVLQDGTARAVATDGHRLAMGSIDAIVRTPGKVLVPQRLIGLLKPMADRCASDSLIDIAFSGDGYIHFTSGAVSLIGRLNTGNFPDYQKVVNSQKAPHVASMPVEALRAAVGRVALFSDERSRCIQIHVVNGSIRLVGKASDLGDSEEAFDTLSNDAEIEAGFNAGYMAEVLDVLGSETVELGYKDHNSALWMRPMGTGATDYTCLVMPMRI